MKISTKGRYAVLAMIDLARNSQTHPIPLPEIAARQDISQHYLEQLFVKMRRANLVKSTRGPGGGYVLGLPPSKVTMKAVLAAVEEHVKPVDCGESPPSTPCPNVPKCGSRLLWRKLEAAIDRTLEETTLEELARGPSSEAETLVRIPNFQVSI